MLVGGVKREDPIDEDAKALALQVKADAEHKAGKKFSTYVPKTFATQVVNGINYFIKVDVGGEALHLRVHKDFQQHVTLHSVKTGVPLDHPVQHF